jgi:hypothetical protein
MKVVPLFEHFGNGCRHGPHISGGIRFLSLCWRIGWLSLRAAGHGKNTKNRSADEDFPESRKNHETEPLQSRLVKANIMRNAKQSDNPKAGNVHRRKSGNELLPDPLSGGKHSGGCPRGVGDGF